jgi:3-oxoacyl-[acyl-carrier protein] reductase
MANEGAKVVLCDVNPETLSATTTELEGKGIDCLGVRCDVSSSESVRQMYDRIKSRFGTLHILVKNAALRPSKPIDEERRKRFYALLTTPIPRQSIGVTKDLSDDERLRMWA